jgi:hypothetical protein
VLNPDPQHELGHQRGIFSDTAGSDSGEAVT